MSEKLRPGPGPGGPYLWTEELVDPAGEEGLLQHGADGGPLPGVASEEQAQQGAQVLGVVQRHWGVGPADDLQDQVLHVARLKLGENAKDLTTAPL